MNIKIIFIVLSILILPNIAYTQNFKNYFEKERNLIKSDSIIELIKKDNVYKAIDNFHNLFYNIDFKDCYYNDSLKSYLLQLLNNEKYIEYQAKISTDIGFQESINYQLEDWLKSKNQFYLYDSIINNIELKTIYSDSIYKKNLNEYIEIYKREAQYSKNYRNLLAFIHYPEAYSIIKEEWKNYGGTRKSKFFDAMLIMHDPDAISVNNNYLDSIKNIDSVELLNKTVFSIGGLIDYGSYYIDIYLKRLEIISKINNPLDDFAENPLDREIPLPYNVFMLSEIQIFMDLCNNTNDTIINNIMTKCEKKSGDSKFFNFHLDSATYEKISQEIIDNIDHFKTAVQPLKDYLISKELYWKQNMTYYKKEEE